MDKKEALKVLDDNIKQADMYCDKNDVDNEDIRYLQAIKVARDTLKLVVTLQEK